MGRAPDKILPLSRGLTPSGPDVRPLTGSARARARTCRRLPGMHTTLFNFPLTRPEASPTARRLWVTFAWALLILALVPLVPLAAAFAPLWFPSATEGIP